jgi:antitoxin VapB
MIVLSRETEALAIRLAAAQNASVDAVVRQALEDHVRAGVAPVLGRRRRMTAEEMLAAGSEIAAMPLLDPRSPREVMDDLNVL